MNANYSRITTTGLRHIRCRQAVCLVACSLILTLAVQAADKADKEQQGVPVATFDSLEHNFGVAWFGETLEHTLTVTNTGTAPLEILRVKPTCGCTLTGRYPTRLAPGEQGKIPFSLDSRRLPAKPFNKPVRITTNDPNNSKVNLVLKGVLKHYIKVDPISASFGRVYGDKPQTKVLTITNNTQTPLHMDLALPPEPRQFTYKLVELEAGVRYEMHVSTIPTTEAGLLKETAKITTNIEKQKTIDIRASASVPERLDVSPTTINIPPPREGEAGRPLRKTIRVSNYGPTPVHVLGVTSDDPEHIKLDRDTLVDGKNYRIMAEFAVGYLPPPNGHTITITTDDKTKPSLTVPVRQPRPRKRATEQREYPAEQLTGKAAPDFTLTLADETTQTKETLAGKIVVIDFFAGNCPHSKRQLRAVDDVRRRYESKGVEFFYVSQTMRGKFFEREQLTKLFEDIDVSGTLVVDPGNTIGPLFKATSYPTLVIIGKTGQIEAVDVGNVPHLDTQLATQLDALRAGRPVPKAVWTAPREKSRRPAMQLIGKPAPSFTLKAMDDSTISSEDFKTSQATVLNFVAPNCPYSRRQLPQVEQLRKAYESRGVRFVNVAQKMRQAFTPEHVRDTFEALGVHATLAYDADNVVGRKYKAVSYPTLVVIDGKGEVKNAYVGDRKGLTKVLGRELDRILAAPTGAAGKK